MNKRLYRSRTKRTLSGVCGGLEDYFDIDVTLIRLAWVLITIMSGGFPGIVAYVIAVFIIPEEPAGYSRNDMHRDSNASYKIHEDEENN
jgi:phage shock protein C